MGKKEKQFKSSGGVNEQWEQDLATAKVEYVALAENLTNMEVECLSTGLPQLDQILHPVKKGLPKGRDIEIYSAKQQSCKTSLALMIARSWQRAGQRVAIIDVENSLDEAFLRMNGLVCNAAENPNVPAARILKHGMGQSDRTDGIVSAEEIFDQIKRLSMIADLVIVDSIAAMESETNLDRMSDDPNQVGGIAKKLAEFLRKTVNKRATIVWINQMRSSIGGYSPAGPSMVTPGGKAMGFHATIMMKLDMIEKISLAKDQPPIGMKIRVQVDKNKIAPPFRWCTLTYLFGKGFSEHYDYVQMAIDLGVIKKSGTWFTFGEERIQGLANLVEMFEQNSEAFAQLKLAVDGEPVQAEDEDMEEVSI